MTSYLSNVVANRRDFIKEDLHNRYGIQGPFRLQYHDWGHTCHTSHIYDIIMQILIDNGHPFDEDTQEVMRLIPLHHDWDQIYQLIMVNGRTQRQRQFRESELVTVANTIEWMDTDPVFNDYHKLLVDHAIMGTAAVFDIQLGTVIHPVLEYGSPIEAWMIVLADVDRSGYYGGECAISDSLTLLLENNPDLDAFVQNPRSSSLEDQEYCLDVTQSWLFSQSAFVRGRKKQFELNPQAFPNSTRRALSDAFGKFDQAEAAVTEQARSIKGLSWPGTVRLLNLQSYR